MADKAWKAFERRIATSLHTVRTPLSGSGSRITSSDTLHPDLYIECKTRQRLAVGALMDVTRRKARKEGKQPIIALHEKNRKRTLAVIDWEFFVKLYGACDPYNFRVTANTEPEP